MRCSNRHQFFFGGFNCLPYSFHLSVSIQQAVGCSSSNLIRQFSIMTLNNSASKVTLVYSKFHIHIRNRSQLAQNLLTKFSIDNL